MFFIPQNAKKLKVGRYFILCQKMSHIVYNVIQHSIDCWISYFAGNIYTVCTVYPTSTNIKDKPKGHPPTYKKRQPQFLSYNMCSKRRWTEEGKCKKPCLTRPKCNLLRINIANTRQIAVMGDLKDKKNLGFKNTSIMVITFPK